MRIFDKLEMLSAENKPPAFNNFMSKETLHMYIFVQVTLTLNRWPWLSARIIKLVTTIDYYSNLYVQKLAFYFHYLEFDLMILVLKLDLDMVVTY